VRGWGRKHYCLAMGVALPLVFVAFALRLPAQKATQPAIVSIRLEQKLVDQTKTVPQNTVFRNGDILRFRLTSHIAGYLYVVDKGTTGEIDTLFPAADAENSSNRIEPDQTKSVPANGDGWFEVTGPSGFDILYFLVSATPIALPPAASPSGQSLESPENTAPPPPGLLPRCDDAIFKARGDCIDASAGIAPLPPGAPLPRELAPLAGSASRDIILTDDNGAADVQPAAAAKLPLIYTFRLAHRD